MLIFILSDYALADCKLTEEYKKARREVSNIVYGSNNSYSKCKASGRNYGYWIDFAECVEKGEGEGVGGGCAHIAGHRINRKTIDVSHCDILKFEPSPEMASKLLKEIVLDQKIIKCEN